MRYGKQNAQAGTKSSPESSSVRRDASLRGERLRTRARRCKGLEDARLRSGPGLPLGDAGAGMDGGDGRRAGGGTGRPAVAREVKGGGEKAESELRGPAG